MALTQDPRWPAVDSFTLSQLHPSSRPNSAALKHALKNSREHGLRDIAVSACEGKFLALQCRMAKVKHALEIGTLGGYNSIWMASENPDLHVTTVELDPKTAEVARENIRFAGLSDRVEVLVGDATKVIETLHAEIEQQKRPRFGFVFIDADMEVNWSFFNPSVELCLPGAAIIVDNIVLGGTIVTEKFLSDKRVAGSRHAVEVAGENPKVDGVVVQMVSSKSYDGILLAVLK
ncbi:O-methyltransferas-like protein family 3 [Xylona heveae TC161]|uniref:O-methyltransferas-like protein family 3 n=1 Tax=Xylona heveae (strain CBS 132557 / TC161) TaxID=1328760 RepID=A0A165IF48_XYLHT|nr:O-methyltransferas-like protein family 3 [Xylona heveae TC161]KZF24808.1 O-methyltransferas-like protein family 3 [Xylona heveae TC161]